MNILAEARAKAEELPQSLPHLLRGYISVAIRRELLPVVWCDLVPGFDPNGGAALFVVVDPAMAKCKRCKALREAHLVEEDRQQERTARPR